MDNNRKIELQREWIRIDDHHSTQTLLVEKGNTKKKLLWTEKST